MDCIIAHNNCVGVRFLGCDNGLWLSKNVPILSRSMVKDLVAKDQDV